MDRDTLLALAERCETATLPLPDRILNRDIARAIGWGYRPPSEMGRKNPGWFHPEDCRHGVPVLDSLHGTDVWREPLDYVGSVDAALTLVGDDHWRVEDHPLAGPCAVVGDAEGYAPSPTLALMSAALRNLAARTQEPTPC